MAVHEAVRSLQLSELCWQKPPPGSILHNFDQRSPIIGRRVYKEGLLFVGFIYSTVVSQVLTYPTEGVTCAEG